VQAGHFIFNVVSLGSNETTAQRKTAKTDQVIDPQEDQAFSMQMG
jgi:hypothetical protein